MSRITQNRQINYPRLPNRSLLKTKLESRWNRIMSARRPYPIVIIPPMYDSFWKLFMRGSKSRREIEDFETRSQEQLRSVWAIQQARVKEGPA